jgi:hypothetical protein
MALSRVSAPLIFTERSGRLTTALRYIVTIVCAASAGIHAALVQPHVEEAGSLVGAAFAAASLALAVAALAARQPRHDVWAPIATTILDLIAVGYLLSRTTGIPLLITDREELDPLVVCL